MSRCVGCDRMFRPKWISEIKNFETHCSKCKSFHITTLDGSVECHELTTEEQDATTNVDIDYSNISF